MHVRGTRWGVLAAQARAQTQTQRNAAHARGKRRREKNGGALTCTALSSPPLSSSTPRP